MKPWARHLWRYLGRAAAALAGALALVGLAVALLLGTSFGRARLLRVALDQADAHLPGRVRVAALDRVSPFGVTLRGIELDDPAQVTVIAVDSLRADLDPLALLHGEIVVPVLEIGPGRIDLRELDTPGRGILAALVDPNAPSTPSEPGPPPVVRIADIALVDLHVAAPALPAPWAELDLAHLSARGSFVLDGSPELALRALSVELLRRGELVARLTRLRAHLARPGTASELELALELGGARVEASARGVLPPAPEWESAPIRARLLVAELRAEELARLLEQPDLAAQYRGPVSLDVALSGDAAALSASGSLGTAGGSLTLQAELRERRHVSVALAAKDLSLRAVRDELPQPPLAFALAATADLVDPTSLPLSLQLRSATLGGHHLLELTAQGRYGGERLNDIVLEAVLGSSWVRARGRAAAGAFDLTVLTDVRERELRTLAAAAQLPQLPRGALHAHLRLAREPAGEMIVRGGARVRGLRWPPAFALDTARLEVDLRGPPLGLTGSLNAELAGLTAADVRVPRARLQLMGDPRAYRLQGDLAVERQRSETRVDHLSTALDLRGARVGEQLRVHGSARGRFEATPFELAIAPTRIDADGGVETDGLALNAEGANLRIKGRYGGPRTQLEASVPDLDLGALARRFGLGEAWTGRARLALQVAGDPQVPATSAQLTLTGFSRNGKAPVNARLAAALDAVTGRSSLDGQITATQLPRWLDTAFSVAAAFRGGPGWTQRLVAAEHMALLKLRALDVAALADWLERPVPASTELELTVASSGTWQKPVVHSALHGKLTDVPGLSPLQIAHQLDYAAGRLRAQLAVADARGPWLNLGAGVELGADAARDLTRIAGQAASIGDATHWDLNLTLAPRALGAVWEPAPDSLAALELGGTVQLRHEPGAEPSGRVELGVNDASERASPAGCRASGARVDLLGELGAGKLQASVRLRTRETELANLQTQASIALAPALRGGAAQLGALGAELSSRRLALAQVPYLCQRVRGTLDAQVKLEDLLGGKPSMTARLDARGVSLGADPSLDLQLTARADTDDAQADLTIVAPGGRSTLASRLPIQWSRGRFQLAKDAPLWARVRLEQLPIAPLLDPAGAVSYANGTISGNVKLDGTLAEPEPSGELELADAELTATALAQPLHGVQGRLSFSRRALRVEHFEARDRDGVLRLSGTLDRRGADALDVKLDATAKRFPLRQLGQVVATTSAHAKVDAAISPARSTVTVQLLDADTWIEAARARSGIDLRQHPDYIDAAVLAAGGKKGASNGGKEGKATPDAAGATPAVESHIVLDASDRVWIKRDDFAIQLSTRLDARISGDEARIQGRVDINRGYLDLMGRVFDVERGSNLEFTGGRTPDPVVDITAAYDNRSSGSTVKVQISGRGSKPELKFLVDDAEVSAGEALEELIGRRSGGSETSAKNEATSFVSGLTAGLLATSARRELGAAAPIIMIEPGEQSGEGRIRAGFELDTLVPAPLRRLITGVYVEGIVERDSSDNQRGQSQQSSTQAGVLLELYFPNQLFSTAQWGPGTTWSLDWGWQL